MTLSAAAAGKILRELKELQTSSVDGVSVTVNEDNIADISAEYAGPAGTPFEGGMFRMKLVLGPDFPEAPPKGYFLTRIFHPNISETGEICVNVLKRDWTASMGLRHVLTVIRCLLVEPNAESALNEEAGRLLLEGFEHFARKARLWTSIHAQAPGILTPATGLLHAGNGALGENVAAEGKDAAAGAKPAVKAKPGVKRGLKRL